MSARTIASRAYPGLDRVVYATTHGRRSVPYRTPGLGGPEASAALANARIEAPSRQVLRATARAIFVRRYAAIGPTLDRSGRRSIAHAMAHATLRGRS